MKITFLGTSCSTPTKDRNLTAVALKYDSAVALFDCPEGTQRQMMKAKVSYMKVKYIFISHLHADHVLGLAGLLATMSLHQRDYPITIFGPRGLDERIGLMLKSALMNVNFEVRVKEARQGVILKDGKYTASAIKLKHDVPCFGYVFEEEGKKGEFNRKKAESLGIPVGPLFGKLQEGEAITVNGKKIKPEMVMDYSKGKPGKKVVYITDTLPCRECINEIKGADVLMHEGVFLDKLKSRAKETKHSTAKEAAEIAEKAKVKALYLVHISPRHREDEKIENEARMIFANSIAPKDLDEVEV